MKNLIISSLLFFIVYGCNKNEIPKACSDYSMLDVTNNEIQFINCSEDASSYIWDFGDGSTSIEESPLHSFQNEFPIQITLIAANDFSSDTMVFEINQSDFTIYPNASFEYILTGSFQRDVEFINNSKNAVRFEWDFGDDNTSSEINPKHSYLKYKSYEVTLTAYYDIKANRAIKNIHVIDTINIHTSFYFTMNENNPKEVHFFNTTMNGDSYEWDFGDQTTSTEKNPVHTYQSYGNFTVTLNAFKGDQSETISKEVNSINPEYIAKACFDFEIDSENPYKIQFINCSSNATEYLWTFNYNEQLYSTEENPEITFENDGEYFQFVVILEVWNDNGGHDEYRNCVPEECNLVGKPNVYIYPEESTQLQIELYFPQNGNIEASVPEYGNGWNVFVETSGLIDRRYDYLFYESRQKDIFQRTQGWCIKQSELKDFFEKNMAVYQFNQNETNDFTKYWVPRLIYSNYFNIYPQTNELIDQIIQLNFSETPDNIIRLFYVIEAVDEIQNITAPSIPNFKREGYVVTEWGVIN